MFFKESPSKKLLEDTESYGSVVCFCFVCLVWFFFWGGVFFFYQLKVMCIYIAPDRFFSVHPDRDGELWAT